MLASPSAHTRVAYVAALMYPIQRWCSRNLNKTVRSQTARPMICPPYYNIRHRARWCGDVSRGIHSKLRNLAIRDAIRGCDVDKPRNLAKSVTVE